MKIPQLSLRELFAIVTCEAVCLALCAAPPTDLSLHLALGLKVGLVLFFAAVIVGGGWQRPFAIGFLVTLLLFCYFPERRNERSYFTVLLVQCFPEPSFQGTHLYGYWTRIIDIALGINLSIVGGLVAREVRRANESRRPS